MWMWLMNFMRQLWQGLRGEVVLFVGLREDRLLPRLYITILFELLTFFIFAQIEHRPPQVFNLRQNQAKVQRREGKE